MKKNEIRFTVGIPEDHRDAAVQLYEDAFGAKFSVAIKERKKRLALLKASLSLDFAIGAIHQDKLLGLAGFSTKGGSLTDGITVKRLLRQLGIWRGIRAILVFSLYDRQLTAGELMMDGISVNEASRGKGIGSNLLDELKSYAIRNGFSTIRLDVIDTNPDARRLYEKQGFVAKKTEYFGFLRFFLGFSASTTMVLTLRTDSTSERIVPNQGDNDE